MGKKGKRTRLAEIPAWALALMAFFITVIFAFFWDYEDPSRKLSAINVTAAIIYDIFMGIVCFVICRTHPKSVWYTPIICIAPIVSSYFFMWPFWTHFLTIWIILGIGIVFSLIGAIVGAIIGRRIDNNPA